MDLAVSIGTGKQFLGKFNVATPARVGLFSGESGGAVLKETFRRVCRAKRIADPTSANVWWCLKLPQLSVQDDLDRLVAQIRKHKSEVVIIDPLYLCLLTGNLNVDASNLYQMGPLLARVAEVCLEAGATPILAHHTKKALSKSFETPELEDLAYAGVQEFARQWLLLGRRERYVLDSGIHRLWLTVGGSAGFSGGWALDIDEGKLKPDFTGRHWVVKVRSASEEYKQADQRRERRRIEKKQKGDEDALERIREVFRNNLAGETKTFIRDEAKVGGKITEFLERLLANGEIEETEIEKPAGRSGTRPQRAYRRVDQEADVEDQTSEEE